MTLADQVAHDASAVFLQSNDYGEAALYYSAAKGAWQTLTVAVHRGEPGARVEVNALVLPELALYVEHGTAKGQLEEHHPDDRVRLAVRHGEPVRELAVPRAVSCRDGLWILEVLA